MMGGITQGPIATVANYMDHPDGVTAKGQAEVINLPRQIEKMAMTEEGEGRGTETALAKGKIKFQKQTLLFEVFNLEVKIE